MLIAIVRSDADPSATYFTGPTRSHSSPKPERTPLRFKEPGWVEFETKGVTLCLHRGRNGGVSKDPNEVSFRVRDFDAVYRSLQLREVPGLGEPHSPCEGVRCVSFQDPDGNRLGIEGA